MPNEPTMYDLLHAALAEFGPAILDVTVSREAYLTSAGALVAVTLRLDAEAAGWVPAAVHERIVRVCWAQGALASVAFV